MKNLIPEKGSNDQAGEDNKFPTRLMIKEAGTISFINIDDIIWFQALDYYVKIHTHSSSHLIRNSLNKLEQTLDPGKFLRIHRSTLVNFEAVKSLTPNTSGDYIVMLNNGTELKLSRTRKHVLDNFLRVR